jgi:hypothetical protein
MSPKFVNNIRMYLSNNINTNIRILNINTNIRILNIIHESEICKQCSNDLPKFHTECVCPIM